MKDIEGANCPNCKEGELTFTSQYVTPAQAWNPPELPYTLYKIYTCNQCKKEVAHLSSVSADDAKKLGLL